MSKPATASPAAMVLPAQASGVSATNRLRGDDAENLFATMLPGVVDTLHKPFESVLPFFGIGQPRRAPDAIKSWLCGGL